MTLKVGAERSRNWSMFEADVPPGFDVGAHLHREAEEVFYVLEGELDLLAFEPRIRTSDDWRSWESDTGAKVVREASCSYRPAARTPSRTSDLYQSGCSSSSPRPATSTTSKRSPSCSLTQSHQTQPRSQGFGPATTSSSSLQWSHAAPSVEARPPRHGAQPDGRGGPLPQVR